MINTLIKKNLTNFVIANGTVIDGTGRDRFKADIRIDKGIIVEIAKNIKSGDTKICAKNRKISA